MPSREHRLVASLLILIVEGCVKYLCASLFLCMQFCPPTSGARYPFYKTWRSCKNDTAPDPKELWWSEYVSRMTAKYRKKLSIGYMYMGSPSQTAAHSLSDAAYQGMKILTFFEGCSSICFILLMGQDIVNDLNQTQCSVCLQPSFISILFRSLHICWQGCIIYSLFVVQLTDI